MTLHPLSVSSFHRRSLVERRVRSFAYLKEVYDGSDRHWLSVISFGPTGPKEEGAVEEPHGKTRPGVALADVPLPPIMLTLAPMYPPAALRWYTLGLSLAALISQPPGAPFVRAVLQLLEEHQYYFSAGGGDRNKGILPHAQHHADEQSLTPSLRRSGGKVLYEHLLTHHVAHALSGVQLAVGLCDLLGRTYRKLAECLNAVAGASSQAVAEAIFRADERIEEIFIAPAARHADGLCKATMRVSLGRLDPLFARVWSGATAGPAGDVSVVDVSERSVDGSGASRGGAVGAAL